METCETLNVLVDTSLGEHTPCSMCLKLSVDSTTNDIFHELDRTLPRAVSTYCDLLLSTLSGILLPSHSTVPLRQIYNRCRAGSQVPIANDAFISLRLSARLRGGKGGFGSQLRAAGGRMSSRKKRQNAELANGSARNLDGRRLRTITEAKNLATYLATKPEMDRREKEERRKRWETVVEMAEQREADMRAGKGPDGRRKGLSEEWMEEKEDIGENVRNAVKAAMLGEDEDGDNETSKKLDAGESSGSSGSANASDDDPDDADVMELDEEDMARLRAEAEAGDPDALWVLRERLKIPSNLLPTKKIPQRKYAGFDDEDEDFESGVDEDDSESGTEHVQGKGKAKA